METDYIGRIAALEHIIALDTARIEVLGRHLEQTQGWQHETRELLEDLSDFLDNYADAETDADGHTHGNRAMGLKSRIDELL